MENGYYWVNFKGIVQIAHFSNGLGPTGKSTAGCGIWHLMGDGVDVYSSLDDVVLSRILPVGANPSIKL